MYVHTEVYTNVFARIYTYKCICKRIAVREIRGVRIVVRVYR